MNQRKILFIIESMGGGGAERSAHSIASSLTKDFIVEFLLLNNAWNYSKINNIKVSVISSVNLIVQIVAIAHHIKKTKPDMVVSVLPSAALRVLVIRRLCRSLNFRWIVRLATVYTKQQKNHNLITKIRNKFFEQISNYADRILIISEESKSDLITNLSFKPNKITVIANGTDKQKIITNSIEPIETPLSFKEIPLIISAGRMSEEKNHSLLISAFNEVQKQKACRLALLGNGPLRDDLRKQAKNLNLGGSVILLPFQKNPWKYIAAADVFVLPSIYEGYPNILIEAMLCKTPIITTNWGAGLAEITMGKEVCVTVEKNNPMEMSKAILTLLNNPAYADKLRQQAFQHAMKNLYDIKDAVRLYETEIKTVLNDAEKRHD
ncbi:MAG: glycosyltransferase [Elusimicrobiaceae bacterium]|nr:glycosyltransferase [Elusimicrobiaceae bacterium]